MVVRKMTDEIDNLSVYIMDAVEHIPSSLMIVFECRVKQICPIPLKIVGRIFPDLVEQISLNIAKQLLCIRRRDIFKTEIPFIVKYLCQF